jgi:hypothetical protein
MIIHRNRAPASGDAGDLAQAVAQLGRGLRIK